MAGFVRGMKLRRVVEGLARQSSRTVQYSSILSRRSFATSLVQARSFNKELLNSNPEKVKRSKTNLGEGLAAQALFTQIAEQQQKPASQIDGNAKNGNGGADTGSGNANTGYTAGEMDWSDKLSSALIGLSIISFIAGGLYLGRPNNDRNVDIDKSMSLIAWYNRASNRIVTWFHTMSTNNFDKLLPDPLPEPLQPQYTLVINMDDTLVRSEWDAQQGWRLKKRAGVDNFLSYLARYYEIVVFTTAMPYVAEPILRKLDPYGRIVYRLYRDSTKYVKGQYIKDLSRLNRNLSKVIIMDIDEKRFSAQPENGILIPAWDGDEKDQRLLEYIPFLEALATFKVEDVRPILKQFHGKDLVTEYARRMLEYEHSIENKRRIQQVEQAKSQRSSWWGMLTGRLARTAVPTMVDSTDTAKMIQEQFLEERRYMEAQAREQQEANERYIKDVMEQMKDQKTTLWRLAKGEEPQLPPSPPSH